MSEIFTPQVIAVLVTAAGNAIGKIITWVGERRDPARTEADEVVEKAYGTLRSAFTDGCVKILKAMENGQLAHPPRIREVAYPDLELPENLVSRFDGELRYRLEYMRLHGVIAPVGPTEYGITDLGQSFLERARRKRDYYNVLFGS